MKKRLIALGVVLAVALGGGALWLLDSPISAVSKEPPQSQQESHLVDFSHWAVILVAGDYRAHNGAPSKVFDNGRHDLARAFAKIGFKPANMVQFSVDYDNGTQHAGVPEIAAAMQTVAARARGGCLIYFTSHGVPEGIIVGDTVLAPNQMRDMVGTACGPRPAVIVMSACYSGQFVAPLQGENRIVMTASRPDRTSFGCGELDHYTFFDDCFLRAMPMADDFPGLGGLVQQCVAEREVQMKATPPSEPQVSVGPGVVFTLRWRGEPAPMPGGNRPT
ncbi:MAG TPA: C13 family peptidase [Rhizomicrobium sp.]|nr:C13 family peptidase [Rhizomicrobium sp.]